MKTKRKVNDMSISQITEDLMQIMATANIKKDIAKAVLSGLPTDELRESMIGLLLALEQENITLNEDKVLKAMLMVLQEENQ